MALEFEFAPIDVCLEGHPKAFDAGPEAMGLWLWGKLHSKRQRTDGRLGRAAVLAAWGGKRNIVLAKRLVDAGLWLPNEDGSWQIFNEEKKGPGRAISSTERMRRLRERRRNGECDAGDVTRDAGDVTRDAGDVTRDASRDVTSVTSCSISLSSGSSDLVTADQDQPDRLPRPPSEPPPTSHPDATAPPPSWWPDVIGTLEVNTGETLPEGEAWIRYAGHRESRALRESRPFPASRGDALSWLTQVMVTEARNAREETRRKNERDAKWERERAAKDSPTPAPYHAPAKAPARSERAPQAVAEQSVARLIAAVGNGPRAG